MKPTAEENLLIYQSAEWECRNAANVIGNSAKQVLHGGDTELWAALVIQSNELKAVANRINRAMETTL